MSLPGAGVPTVLASTSTSISKHLYPRYVVVRSEKMWRSRKIDGLYAFSIHRVPLIDLRVRLITEAEHGGQAIIVAFARDTTIVAPRRYRRTNTEWVDFHIAEY